MTNAPEPAARFTVRRANAADAELLLAWRNDPVVRRWSRTSEVIDPDAHARWLHGTLADADRHLLVVQMCGDEGDLPVATARYDLLPSSAGPTDRARWEISISVAPEMRGRGVGGGTLRAADDWLAVTEPAAEEVVAEVLPGNEGSDRLFRRNGYVPTAAAAAQAARYVRRLPRR